MEREKGFEPSLVAWKASVLAVNTTPARRPLIGIAPHLPVVWVLATSCRGH